VAHLSSFSGPSHLPLGPYPFEEKRSSPFPVVFSTSSHMRRASFFPHGCGPPSQPLPPFPPLKSPTRAPANPSPPPSGRRHYLLFSPPFSFFSP
jgi:hypothetical protein